jgi:hypothetical protein
MTGIEVNRACTSGAARLGSSALSGAPVPPHTDEDRPREVKVSLRCGRISDRGVLLSGCLVAALVLGACGSATSSAPTTTTASTTTTTARPSAAGDLAAFFASAAASDQRLKAAAALVNGDISRTQLVVTRATEKAIAAAVPTASARAIPAGLPPGLLLPVLLVQSDLVSRYWAMRGWAPHGLLAPADNANPVPIADWWARYALTCLGNGAVAAARFDADVAAARAAAAAAPPVTAVPPYSRAAADLAILLNDIEGRNAGCLSCGGTRETSLPTIMWYATPRPMPNSDKRADGDIHGIAFSAHYAPAKGWTIEVWAC